MSIILSCEKKEDVLIPYSRGGSAAVSYGCVSGEPHGMKTDASGMLVGYEKGMWSANIFRLWILVLTGVFLVVLISSALLSTHFRHHGGQHAYKDTTAVMPRIIHQTWSSHDVPSNFTPWIQSWLKHNPEWEYWFWSRSEIDAFLQNKYPDFTSVFDEFAKGVMRADALRYMILHEFGGLYADLDMECLKALDELRHYNCFLSEENYEHVNLLYNRRDPIMINCIMGCRAKHPFYEMVLKELPSRSSINDPVKGTGPMFFSQIHEDYQKKEDVPLSDHISVLPPRYLMAARDFSVDKRFKKKCSNLTEGLPELDNLPKLDKVPKLVYKPSLDMNQTDRNVEICQILTAMEYSKDLPPHALTAHHWVHTWFNKDSWDKKPAENIKNIVPSVKFYTHIIHGSQKSKYYS